MTEIYRLWTPELPPYPGEDIAAISKQTNAGLREVCCCFWLFRYLHRFEEPLSVLVGDYCFGRFSHRLSELDSVPLTDAFAAFLRRDCLENEGISGYMEFVRSLERLDEHI